MGIREEQRLKIDYAKRRGRQTAARQCAELGLPDLWAVYKSGYVTKRKGGTRYPQYSLGKLAHAARWKKFVQTKLPEIERQLTAWEDAHPEQYRSLPWYDAREAYKAAKAAGEVQPPEWWAVMGASKSFERASAMNRALKAKTDC